MTENLKLSIALIVVAALAASIVVRERSKPKPTAAEIHLPPELVSMSDVEFWHAQQWRLSQARQFDQQALAMRQTLQIAKSPEHEAGYAWALQYGMGDPDKCNGLTRAFIEGCFDYAGEHEPALHIDEPTSGDKY